MKKLIAVLVAAIVLSGLGIGITAGFRNDARLQGSQETIIGEPGAPSARRVISGEQLPPLPSKFGGAIEKTSDKAKPYWPPRTAPRPGAPNVLLIITDDV